VFENAKPLDSDTDKNQRYKKIKEILITKSFIDKEANK